MPESGPWTLTELGQLTVPVGSADSARVRSADSAKNESINKRNNSGMFFLGATGET